MEPGCSMPYSQGLSNNLYPNPCIDTYPFKVHSNIVLPSTPGPPSRSLSYRFTCYNFESTSIFLHYGYIPCPSQSFRFNHPDYIRWTVQTMKFLIMEPPPLPILIPIGPKYLPLTFYKTCWQCRVNDERPTGKKNTTTEWDDDGKMGNKNKCILTSYNVK